MGSDNIEQPQHKRNFNAEMKTMAKRQWHIGNTHMIYSRDWIHDHVAKKTT